MKKIYKKVVRQYLNMRSLQKVILSHLNFKANLNLATRFSLIINGFHSDKSILYNFNDYSQKDFISDFVEQRTAFINNEYSFILRNKIIAQQILSPYLRCPQTFAIVSNGTVIPFGDEGRDDYKFIINICKKYSKIVLKPIGSSGGKGVKVLEYKNELIEVNSETFSETQFKEFLLGLENYMVTEHINQGDFPRNLFHKTTNTMRIVTMVDPKTKTPFIARAIQRIGNNDTIPIDNFSGGKGGLNSMINLETGILGPGVTLSEKGTLESYDKHPDSNTRITGLKIPNWEGIKQKILKTINELPYLVYVGWDVVISGDEIVVIEANNTCGFRALQVHEPLLLDEKIKEFYKYHKVI